MKTKLLSLGAVLVLTTFSLPAANIAWVSFHSADDVPSANAAAAGFTNAPDVGYTALLAANGHTVARFVTVDNLQNNPALIADINTNDVAIISRSVPSGHYEVVAETAAWNVAVNIPVISMGGYINRANRLGFNTGTSIPDANSPAQYLKVNFPAHPIFNGIALDGNNVMVNPYSQRVTYTNSVSGVELLQSGISVVTNPIVAGGTVLATIATPGDAATNGLIIGEFPAGTTLQRGDVLSARRLVFLSGTRESGIHSEGSGIFDLQADGATMFLNAVNYMMPPPTPPQITSQPVGATNLVAGDAWTLTVGVNGSNPRFYQWYKDGTELAGATSTALTFTSLVNPTDAGEYYLIATNSSGSATSMVARLEFLTYAPSSITNGLIAYWPLDAATGTKTVDLVSSYDMSLVNLSGADIVPGKWGSAFQFNGTNSYMERLHATNDALPVYQHPNFTVSFWVNAAPQSDKRVYAEGSLTDTDPMFSLGSHNTGADLAIDVYIRNDTGGTVGDHRHGVLPIFDGQDLWRNVVYVQRVVGNGLMKAQVWVDGVLDTIVINPVRPVTANTTAFGALRRAAASALFTGKMDEVATWNRALSPEEIAILQLTQITNPPSRIQPLAINSFKADLPAVVGGGSTTLRWDVSKDVTQVTISGIGDVTAQTSVGIGSQVISPVQSTNYVLTVVRGVDSLSATTAVAVVTGVNPGWALLDNFDQSQVGNLSASGYWNDTSGTAGQVVNVYGNNALRSTDAGVAFLNLRNLTVAEGQARTLFFRMIAGADNAAGVTNIVGLTDKSQRNFADAFANIGPVLYAAPFTNVNIPVDTNGWYVGARNLPGGIPDYLGNQPQLQTAFESATVYNLWVDITNAPMAEFAYDIFSVYVQAEGGGARTLLFQDYASDRDFFIVDPVLGGMLPNLDKLVVMGNSATVSAVLDDFYLSTGGYNTTVPKPSAFVIAPGPLSIGWSGNQIQIAWPDGTLQSSTNAAGPYVDVPGNPTSPLLVSPAGERVFYRSRK